MPVLSMMSQTQTEKHKMAALMAVQLSNVYFNELDHKLTEQVL